MGRQDKIKGGIADKMTAEDIADKHNVSTHKIKTQLQKGKKVEMEHVNNQKMAEEIALDHLSEIPDYYTRLEKMEKDAKRDLKSKKKMNEDVELSSFAKRMRELSGLSEGNDRKSLKTIQEGLEFPGEDYELEDRKSQFGINPELENQTDDITDEEMSFDFGMNDDFDTIEFGQSEIEEGESDSELYNLNEGTIIVLDFLEEGILDVFKKNKIESAEEVKTLRDLKSFAKYVDGRLIKGKGYYFIANSNPLADDFDEFQIHFNILNDGTLEYSEDESYYGADNPPYYG